MKRVLASFVVLSLLSMNFFGCAAMLQGTRQMIQANSTPNGAKILVSPTNEEYVTPAMMNLERKYNYVLTFSKKGYSTAKFNIHKKLDVTMLLLDVLFTGVLGVIVDAATGAWYDLTPEFVTVTLERLNAANGPDEIKVYVRMEGDSLIIESDEPGVNVSIDKQN